MRIFHLAAGAGDMFCGACARDAALFRGITRRGHDLEVLQLYTPLRLEDDDSLRAAPVFLGGINAYLQQISPLFRYTPAWLDDIFDSPALLRWAGRFAVRTQPEKLGPMTVSVLQGSDGRQRKELGKLIHYLETRPRPDIVSITNSLLSGIAPVIKARLGAPIVCSLQGEDYFVEAMPDRYAAEAQRLMRTNARSIDLFLSPGTAYAEKMETFLDVEPGRVRLVRPGIDASAFHRTEAPGGDRFVLGYLSSIGPRKGLDILVEAFLALRAGGTRVVLRAAGKVLDPRYWNRVLRRIRMAGAANDFAYLGEVDFHDKVRLLRSCHGFCVPSRIAESRGVAVMEALAAGVPVAAPRSGIFPEIAELTGGIRLFNPEDADDLERVLRGFVENREEARRIGSLGAEGVSGHLSADGMVDTAIAEYEQLANERLSGAEGSDALLREDAPHNRH